MTEQGLNGASRRKEILAVLKSSQEPVSGSALGKLLGVSRQVVVQDMALLRTEGYDILATARGYTIAGEMQTKRVMKLFHMNDRTEEELTTIVDLGGSVLDVIVNHRVYGKVTAPLNIKNRRDVQMFMNELRTGKSTPLLNVTSGYHFHTILADREEILDEIETELRAKGLLSEILPYEKEVVEI